MIARVWRLTAVRLRWEAPDPKLLFAAIGLEIQSKGAGAACDGHHISVCLAAQPSVSSGRKLI